MIQFILELLKEFIPDIGTKIGIKWGDHLKSKYPNLKNNKGLKGLGYLIITTITICIIMEFIWLIDDGPYWIAGLFLLTIASIVFKTWWKIRRKMKNEIRYCPICTCTLLHGETICRFCDASNNSDRNI